MLAFSSLLFLFLYDFLEISFLFSSDFEIYLKNKSTLFISNADHLTYQWVLRTYHAIVQILRHAGRN